MLSSGEFTFMRERAARAQAACCLECISNIVVRFSSLTPRVHRYLMGEESITVLDQIHEQGTENGIPRKQVMIADCGEILLD